LKQGPSSGNHITLNRTTETKFFPKNEDGSSIFPEIKQDSLHHNQTIDTKTKPGTSGYSQSRKQNDVAYEYAANRTKRKKCGDLKDMGAPENVVYDENGNMGKILEGKTINEILYFKILDEENRKKMWVALSTLQKENNDKYSLIDVWCQKVQNCTANAGETCPSEDNCSVDSYPSQEEVQRNCAK
jgi:hypothetical protein